MSRESPLEKILDNIQEILIPKNKNKKPFLSLIITINYPIFKIQPVKEKNLTQHDQYIGKK